MGALTRRVALMTAAVSAAAVLLTLGHFISPATRTVRVLPPIATRAETLAAVRQAADALEGAVAGFDDAGQCAMLSRKQRLLAATGMGSCERAARVYSLNFAGSAVLIGQVELLGPRWAIVHEKVEGEPTLWTFRVERGRWVLTDARHEPTA